MSQPISEDKWAARMDAEVLKQASEVQQDTTRFANAKAELQRQAEAIKAVTGDSEAIGTSTVPGLTWVKGGQQ